MQFILRLKARVAKLPYAFIAITAAISAFGAYTSMYAFRKAFAAGTYPGETYLHIDYKVWLVIAQIVGYTLSKFYGIKFIAEMRGAKRGLTILMLVGIAWLALSGFALVPAPYNILFLFINGFPLGLIWGLIFGYLEGRKSTEFMAAVLSISLIFGSGFVKTIGQTLIHTYHVSEYNMPFLTGALFAIPLIFFVFILELMPPQTAEDKVMRAERLPMNKTERRNFIIRFLPGIILTLIVYVLLTVMRDIRDNFEVEIWNSLGIHDKNIYARIDTRISVVVLIAMSLLILVKKNLRAFSIIHVFIIAGCALVGVSTFMFSQQLISPVSWMTMAGLGLYLGYVPYNAIFFERMIATFRYKSNVGFIMYIADSMGYLGSVTVLLVKELGRPNISWGDFFKEGVMAVAIVGGVCASLSFIYFFQSARKKPAAEHDLNFSTI
ncbi:MFS family permease [Pedobacter sp. UYEF25]